MPDHMLAAKFLSEEEHVIAVERIHNNRIGFQTPEWKWSHFWQAASDLRTGWVCVYTIVWLIPLTSRYPNMRCVMHMVVNLPAFVGAALINGLSQSSRAGRLIGFYLVNFTNATMPILRSLTTSNIGGHTKRTT